MSRSLYSMILLPLLRASNAFISGVLGEARAKSSFYLKGVAMSSVLLVKTAVTDREVAPQVLCDEGPRLADNASRTLASPVALTPSHVVARC